MENNMRTKLLCISLLGMTILLLIIVLFFRDRTLFFLAGQDYALSKETSVNAFKAYASIQKWRIALICMTLLISVVSFFLCSKMAKQEGYWVYTFGKYLSLVASLLMGLILLASVVLPKRIF